MTTSEQVKASLDSILKLYTVSDINSPSDITEAKKETVFNVIMALRNLSDSLSDIEKPNFSFFNRDFISIMFELMDEAQKRFPNWVNFSKRELSTCFLEIFAGLLDKFYYHCDQVFTNWMLPVLNTYEGVLMKAQESMYPIKGRAAASVSVTFSLATIRAVDVFIPSGTKIYTTDRKSVFETVESGTILAGARTVTVVAQNKQSISEPFSAVPDLKNQQFTLSQSGVLINDLQVIVGGEIWEKVDSVLLLQKGDKGYSAALTSSESCIISFGDGEYSGVIPTGVISVSYAIGGGYAANFIGTNQITRIGSTIKDVADVVVADITVTNRYSPSGGSDREGLNEAKKNIMAWIASTNRSIVRVDFERNAEYVEGVQRAFAIDRPYVREHNIAVSVDPYQVILYVIPDDGVTLTNELKDEIRNMFQSTRKSFGSVAEQLVITEALYQDWDIVGDIYFKPGANWGNVIEMIKDSIRSYFSFTNTLSTGEYVVNLGSEMELIAKSQVIALAEQFRTFGVINVKLTEPTDDVSIDALYIPRIGDITLRALDEDGLVLT
jgi:hypothetical protein